MLKKAREPAKTTQRKLALQLGAATGLSEQSALALLKSHSWSVEAAADAHFSSDTSSRVSFNAAKLSACFDTYAETDNRDVMSFEGIDRFCNDVGLDVEDVRFFALAYRLKSDKMGEITRRGWLEGWSLLHLDSVEDMKQWIASSLAADLSDPPRFRDIYAFVFKYALSDNQKSLPVDVAVALWELLLPSKFPLLQRWISFVQGRNLRGISKDTWMQLLEFATTIQLDLSNYDEAGSWPVLLDEVCSFVASCHDIV